MALAMLSLLNLFFFISLLALCIKKWADGFITIRPLCLKARVILLAVSPAILSNSYRLGYQLSPPSGLPLFLRGQACYPIE